MKHRQFMRFLIIFTLFSLAACAAPAGAPPAPSEAAAAAPAAPAAAAPPAEPAAPNSEPDSTQALAKIESSFAEKIGQVAEGTWAGDLVIIDEVLVYGEQAAIDRLVEGTPWREVEGRRDLTFVNPTWESRLYQILDGTASTTAAEKLNEMARQAGVAVYAEPNLLITGSGHGGSVFGSPSVPPVVGPRQGFATQWVWTAQGINLAPDRAWQGDGITVGIFDTCPNKQPTWVDQMLPITTLTGANLQYLEHGAGVASLIDYMVPAAQLELYCVLTPDGYGKLSDLVAGLANFINQHKADDTRLIINLSLGVNGLSNQLATILKRANELEIVAVAAAGNQSNPTVMNTPAVYSTVIGVAGNTSNRQPSSFTNIGDVSAPAGGNLPADEVAKVVCEDQPTLFIITRADSSPTGHLCWLGTSFATPLVTGEAALLLNKTPTLSAADVATKIYSTANPLVAILGAGVINVDQALQ